MFGTVTAIIVLYVIGLLVGRRYDKKDREKVSNFVSTMRFTMDVLVYVFIPRFSSVSHIKFWPVSPVPSKLKKEVFFPKVQGH